MAGKVGGSKGGPHPREGLTTIEEVMRVTQTEEHLGLMADKP